MQPRLLPCLVLALGFAAGSVRPSEAPDPASLVSAGIEASRRGEDMAALEAFDAAVRAGLDTPRLHYNRGVVLLRLDRPAEAAAAFRRATVDPDLAALAHYHLGRIARDRQDWTEANGQFRRAAAAARTPQLRQMAGMAQDRLPPPPPPGLILLELALGYDTAAGFRDEDLGARTRKGDLFGSLWVYGDRWLVGDAFQGLRGFGSLTAVGHLDERDADLLLLDGGAGLRRRLGIWETEGGLALQHIRLGGDTLETMAELYAEGGRPLRAGDPPHGPRLHLRYRLGVIAGGDEFGYLDGTRQDVRVRFHGQLGPGRWSADYTLEVNHRDDLDTAAGFASASPVRHRFGAGWRQALTDTLDLGLSASWRQSRFRGQDTLADGSSRRRQDERLFLSGTLTRREEGRPWNPFVRLDWTDNTSNIPVHAYDRLRAALGVERMW